MWCNPNSKLQEGSKSETISNPNEGMKKDISSPPETLKLQNPETLSICLEHSLAASSEARHQRLLPSARSLGNQSSSSDSALSGSKPIHIAGPDTSRSNLLLMFGFERYILLH
jgi:hypothetical protein